MRKHLQSCVSLRKLRATDSMIRIFPRLTFPDEQSRQYYTICPSLVQAHSYGSFPPIPNNILPDKD